MHFFSFFIYILGQIVAFYYLFNEFSPSAVAVEGRVSIAGLVLCSVTLIGYIIYQLMIPKLADMKKKKMEEIAKEKKIFYQTTLVIKRLRENANVPIIETKTEEQVCQNHFLI